MSCIPVNLVCHKDLRVQGWDDEPIHVSSRNDQNTRKSEFCIYFHWEGQTFISLNETSNFEPQENAGRTGIFARKDKIVHIIRYTAKSSNNDSNAREANDSPWQWNIKETPINSFATLILQTYGL